MKQAQQKQFAHASGNLDFIHIQTASGENMSVADPLGTTHMLAPDASDEVIGAALLDCLSHSRFLPYEENRGFYDDMEASERRIDEWVKATMKQYKYRSRRALFFGVDVCTVEKYGGNIVIEPSCHVRSEFWVRRKTDAFEDVIIPDSSLPNEIGKALRVAFSRCTGE
ncbi:MAG TPA: contact-dependent growth inhibition system immunity protein [Verrucomicrobiae bacterium]|nr:contact-dependent growth inhibition system immunity protein [Verrucomicrobiae bacterium]